MINTSNRNIYSSHVSKTHCIRITYFLCILLKYCNSGSSTASSDVLVSGGSGTMYCFLKGGNDSLGFTPCVVSSSANLSCKCLTFSLFRSPMILLLKLRLCVSSFHFPRSSYHEDRHYLKKWGIVNSSREKVVLLKSDFWWWIVLRKVNGLRPVVTWWCSTLLSETLIGRYT